MTKLFNFKHIQSDLFGGITAGVVALPLALAFGVSSGLGPSAGLYGAIFISFFAALFGGTNTQISGPTAPMTAISAVVIASILADNEGDLNRAVPLIFGVFVLVGLIQILLGIIGMGKYIKYIPYPVVSGFMTAIGVIILITQLVPALGYYPTEDAEYVARFERRAEEALVGDILKQRAGDQKNLSEHVQDLAQQATQITPEQIRKESRSLAAQQSSGVIGAVNVLPRAIRNINWLELLLTGITIAIIYSFKRITIKVPSTLVALLLVSGSAYLLGLNYKPISTIPSGLPQPLLNVFTSFSLSGISPYIFMAISLAFLGCIDSLLTSVVADNMTKTKHNPNQELIGQGIGNSIAAIFGGLPGAGATIRTVVNINSGGKTRLSGMIAGVLLLLVLLALSPAASQIPAAVLAGILITVGIGVMDYKGLRALRSMPLSEGVIMLIVLVLSTFWNLVYAVGIGLVIASLMFMKKIGDLTAKQTSVTSLSENQDWSDELEFSTHLRDTVFVKFINGPLFFGFTTEFQEIARQIPETARIVIIHMGRVPYIDQSGLYAMEDVLKELVYGGKIVLISGLNEQPELMLQQINIIPDVVPEENVFPTVKDGLLWIQSHANQAGVVSGQ